MKTVHLVIRGKVQGVYFRNTAMQVAEKLKVTAWIKNTSEANVEAMVTGDENAIQESIKWCKIGPERAIVNEVTISKKPETLFESFRILRN